MPAAAKWCHLSDTELDLGVYEGGTMTPLYTQDQFNSARSRDTLPLACLCCQQTYHRAKHHIQTALSRGRRYDFCSKQCESVNLRVKRQVFSCKQCGTEVLRKPGELRTRQAKNLTHHFCSTSCAGTYNSQHKTTGTRRSKLEQWIEQSLATRYPNLEVHYNRTDAIMAELDIYVPSLKLAFELNGIFHYEPIFGNEKLDSIQKNDKRKYQACLEHGIELCIIDTAAFKHFKPLKAQRYLDIVLEILEHKSGATPPTCTGTKVPSQGT